MERRKRYFQPKGQQTKKLISFNKQMTTAATSASAVVSGGISINITVRSTRVSISTVAGGTIDIKPQNFIFMFNWLLFSCLLHNLLLKDVTVEANELPFVSHCYQLNVTTQTMRAAHQQRLPSNSGLLVFGQTTKIKLNKGK